MEEKSSPKIFSVQSVVSRMRLLRFAKIFSHISIASIILVGISVLAMVVLPVASFFLMLAGILISLGMVVFSLGFVFTMPINPAGLVWDFAINVFDVERTELLLNLFISLIPYLCFIGIGVSIASIVFVSICRLKNKVGRIVGMSIIIVLLAIVLGLFFLLGGSL